MRDAIEDEARQGEAAWPWSWGSLKGSLISGELYSILEAVENDWKKQGSNWVQLEKPYTFIHSKGLYVTVTVYRQASGTSVIALDDAPVTRGRNTCCDVPLLLRKKHIMLYEWRTYLGT